MSKPPFFSICIPAYKRREDLCRAIESCLAQSDGDLEVLIGDDTPDDSVKQVVVERFSKESRVRYFHNQPSLRQAANVNNLFAEARGEWIVLVHDDDYLEPAALLVFRGQIKGFPEADLFFGKQHLESERGRRDLSEPEVFNAAYGRVPEAQGLLENPKGAVLRSQVPSNGFCVRAARAKSKGYPGLPDSGDACDWAFSARLALDGCNFVYTDVYVSTYSVSNNSIGRNNPKNDATLNAMKIGERYFADQKMNPDYLKFFLSRMGGAISQALYHQNKTYAWHLIRQAWSDRRVPRGLVFKQIVKIILFGLRNNPQK